MEQPGFSVMNMNKENVSKQFEIGKEVNANPDVLIAETSCDDSVML